MIAVCADRVIMQDFAKLMIHDPFFSDNGAMTAKQRKMLDKIRDMLLGVLMRRGKNEEEISRLMTEETWFSAKEAREMNLCDEILASNRAESFLRLTPQQIITQISAEYQPQNQNVMNLTNEAAELLKLKAEATEAEVSAAVVALHGRVATQTKRADDAEQRAKAAENELSEIRKAQAEERKKEAETPGRHRNQRRAHQRCGQRVLPGPVRKKTTKRRKRLSRLSPAGRISPIKSAAKTPLRSGRRSSKP